ncbi:MAG TPA: PAS domain-containing protein, partial [Pseudolabrys sp.]
MTAQVKNTGNGRATAPAGDAPGRESSGRQSYDRSDRAPRSGSVGLVVLIAVALVGTAAALIYIGRTNAEPYIMAVLAFLATIGVFSLFAMAAGILQTQGQAGIHPLTKALADGAPDGLIITDRSGRVFYANAAYLDLIRSAGPDDVRPIERAFAGDPDVSEAIYRLLKAGREGQPLQEEIRLGGADD